MWDLFCEVVDNFGDIGVSWRLARTLASEHGVPMRLWVDDLAAFARIEPRVDAQSDIQVVDGVEVRHWSDPFAAAEPGAVVIEAFGCRLPECFLDAMAARARAPVWINLEYLTAEPWAERHHGLPSPHPRLPLIKHFFFPGFTARTGGVLREAGLLGARDAAQAGQAGASATRAGKPLRVSVFAYANPAWPALLEGWARGVVPVQCLVPEGPALEGVRAYLGRSLAPGESAVGGALAIEALPFADQTGYDRLLWSCDWNFVRGEDSFVRAQWAARPLVWHIYPQEAGAHHAKLDAFMARYAAGLAEPAAAAWSALLRAWNDVPGAPPIGTAWTDALACEAALRARSGEWAEQLAAGPELAASLAEFVIARLK